jgi:D-tyrosyl-tRNA(Tyr) deacylase
VIALIQRVSHASVTVQEKTIAKIGNGLLVLLGVARHDTRNCAARLAQKVISYRVFEDMDGKMNRSLLDIAGDALIVPQFTLAAETTKGTRPGFSTAAPPELGLQRFNDFVTHLQSLSPTPVQTGMFGADMQVELINTGPVTFWLETPPPKN